MMEAKVNAFASFLLQKQQATVKKEKEGKRLWIIRKPEWILKQDIRQWS